MTCPAPPRELVTAGNWDWCGRNATWVRKAGVQSQVCGPLPFALSPSKDGVPKGLRDCRGKRSTYIQTCVISFMSLLHQTLKHFGLNIISGQSTSLVLD